MAESIAKRVARELHYDDPGNEWLNEQDNRKSAELWLKWATQRIQAAIDEAVAAILTFLDERTPDDASMEHWAAKAYQEIGAKFLVRSVGAPTSTK